MSKKLVIALFILGLLVQVAMVAFMYYFQYHIMADEFSDVVTLMTGQYIFIFFCYAAQSTLYLVGGLWVLIKKW